MAQDAGLQYMRSKGLARDCSPGHQHAALTLVSI